MSAETHKRHSPTVIGFREGETSPSRTRLRAISPTSSSSPPRRSGLLRESDYSTQFRRSSPPLRTSSFRRTPSPLRTSSRRTPSPQENYQTAQSQRVSRIIPGGFGSRISYTTSPTRSFSNYPSEEESKRKSPFLSRRGTFSSVERTREEEIANEALRITEGELRKSRRGSFSQ